MCVSGRWRIADTIVSLTVQILTRHRSRVMEDSAVSAQSSGQKSVMVDVCSQGKTGTAGLTPAERDVPNWPTTSRPLLTVNALEC